MISQRIFWISPLPNEEPLYSLSILVENQSHKRGPTAHAYCWKEQIDARLIESQGTPLSST